KGVRPTGLTPFLRPRRRALPSVDAGGRNLGWDAVGHRTVVVDAQAVPHLIATGVGGVHLYLLASGAVAHQQGIAPHLQHPGGHGGGGGGWGTAGAAAAPGIGNRVVTAHERYSSPGGSPPVQSMPKGHEGCRL